MLAMTMSIRMMGPREWLETQLEATRSSSYRANLIRKLALCHDPAAIQTIAPYLADGEARVRGAAIDAILHFGEDAREPMLDVLRNPHQAALHPAALRILATIVRAALRNPLRTKPTVPRSACPEGACEAGALRTGTPPAASRSAGSA